jgi:hypothetical protein
VDLRRQRLLSVGVQSSMRGWETLHWSSTWSCSNEEELRQPAAPSAQIHFPQSALQFRRGTCFRLLELRKVLGRLVNNHRNAFITATYHLYNKLQVTTVSNTSVHSKSITHIEPPMQILILSIGIRDPNRESTVQLISCLHSQHIGVWRILLRLVICVNILLVQECNLQQVTTQTSDGSYCISPLKYALSWSPSDFCLECSDFHCSQQVASSVKWKNDALGINKSSCLSGLGAGLSPWSPGLNPYCNHIFFFFCWSISASVAYCLSSFPCTHI